MTDEPEKASEKADPETVRFHFIKSNAYRVVHADGIYGGITPQGRIHANFYSERSAIPQSIVHSLVGEKLGPELPQWRTGKDGIVRELEVCAILDVPAAESMVRWLTDQIQKVKELRAEAMKAAKKQ